MADKFLSADAHATAQVRSATLTAYDAATTYRITINGKVVSQIGTGGTTTTTATAFATALNASTIPEFAEATWSSNGAVVTGTMDDPGVPFTFTTSVSGGTGTIGAASDTTSNDGPEALTANNVKDASSDARALPSASDTFTIESLDSDLKYALDALSGLTLAALYIEATMEGQVGLPPVNENGAINYDDYRVQYLTAPATICTIGDGDGDGSDLIMHSSGSVLCGWTILKSQSDGAIDGIKPIVLKGTNASNTLKVMDASVDVAPFAGETSTILTLTASGSADVRTSSGVTLGTVNASGNATVDITSATALSDITAINIYDNATVIIRGDNAITAITLYGSNATLIYLGSGTIGTLTLVDSPTINAADNLNSFTVTTLSGSGAPVIKDPAGKLTVTNAITTNNSDVFEWDWQLRQGRAITLGAA
jgi:hypothetical protein